MPAKAERVPYTDPEATSLLGEAPPPRQPYGRNRQCVVCSGVGVVAAFCIALLALKTGESSTHASSSHTAAHSSNACGETDAEGFRHCSYDSSALLAFDRVAAFVGEDAERLLPRKLEFAFSQAEMEQGIGAEGSGGFVAFSLFRPTVASYLVVVDVNGTVARAAPTTWLDGDDARPTRLEAVKFVDPRTVVAASSTGRVYTWAWKDGGDLEAAYASGDGGDSGLDVQQSVDGRSYWQPSRNGSGSAFDRVADGAVISKHAVPNCSDVNHAQLVENETRAVVSCRGESSFASVDVASGVVEWTAGGPFGTLTLVDEDGTTYEPGTYTPWSGQHNVEYVGDDTYLFFDNGYGAERASRLLGAKVDAENGTLTIESAQAYVDEFPYGYAPLYGDHDRLPSGNSLGTWWPILRSPSRATFDAQIGELSPAGTAAWALNIYGFRACDDDGDSGCAQTKGEGWKVYSAERGMDRPVVHGATYGDGQLSFYAHAPVKLNHLARARWSLRTTEWDDAKATSRDVSSGLFMFDAYWRGTYHAVELAPTTPWGFSLCVGNGTMAVHVWDEWGSETVAPVDCATQGMA